MEAVQVTLTDLKNKVEQGWKKDALAQHYGLPKSQVATLLKQASLTIRKFHQPKFVLVDDTREEDVLVAPNESLDIMDIVTNDAIQEIPVVETPEQLTVEPVLASVGTAW